MTIFVDDLDRCEPKLVMQVLQWLNFLSSSGECFLIVGMEEQAVKHSVKISLEEQRSFHAEPDRWLEKFVQIRVSVPDANDLQFKALLTGPDLETKKADWPGWGSWIGRALIAGWQQGNVLIFTIITVTLMAICYQWVDQQLRQSQATAKFPSGVSWSSNSFIRPEVPKSIVLESPEGFTGTNLMTNVNFTNWIAEKKWAIKLQFEGPNFPLVAAPTNIQTVTEPRTEPGRSNGDPEQLLASNSLTVQPGQTDHSLWWLPVVCVVMLLFYGGKRLIDRLNRQVPDSEDFRNALVRWEEIINKKHRTPRSAKRLINKLRFFAMMMRALRPAENGLAVPENAIVAFGVLNDPNGMNKDEALKLLRSSDLLADQEAMELSIKRYPEIFRYLQTTFEEGKQSNEPVPD